VRATLTPRRGTHAKKVDVSGVFLSPDLQRRYARVVQRLIEEPQRYFEGAEAPVFLPILSLRRPVSELVKCRAESPHGSCGVYIKFFLPRSPTPEAHQRAVQRLYKEVEVTRDFYARLGGNSVYAVPRIIAFFPEEKAIVMEESTGQRLLDILLQKGRGYPTRSALHELAQYCRAVGGWLKHFQSLTQSATDTQLEHVDFLEYVAVRLAKLQASQRVLCDEVAERLLDSLKRLLQQVPEHAGKVCGVHGDLSLSNILVTSDKVTVLDFSMYQIGSLFNDPAYFYSRIESVYHLMIKRSTTYFLQNAFIEGYGIDIKNSIDQFRIYYIRHKINRILSLSDFNNLPFFKRWYQKYQLFKCWKDLNRAMPLT
jgi:tRNA A-37 threonylcarbamoyl transferase component Bud32